ncbi:hypothetical protein Fmac_030944 [Flemingia macrophylla]|uniref:Transport inhibitor response 1 domain-containing protein n=1 Tax=Flemingia macrophylla TaxID=520843 RepID=A0ABD1L0N4_9FABA
MTVTDSDLQQLAPSRGSVLQVHKLDKCSGFSTDGLYYIGHFCRSLRILFLEESSLVDNDGDWLHELALNNRVIETLNFYRIPMFNINIRDLELIARNCTNLVYLKIGNHHDVLEIQNFFGYATALEQFSGGSYNYQLDHNVIRLPDKLCRLGLTFFSEDKMRMVAPNAALLKKLDFFYSTLNTEYHCTLIQMCPNLKVLEDKMGMVAPNAALLKKLDLFYSTLDTESLRILFLEVSSLVDNDGDWLHELAFNNTVLETLNFYRIPMFNTNIRDLELIARNCPNLVSLKIGNHHEVLEIQNFFAYATALEEFSGEDKMDMVDPNAALLKKLDLFYSTLDTERLRILFLEVSSLVDNDGDWLHELAFNNTVLETLNFYRIPMFNINIRDLELIARNYPNLVSLKIGNHHEVLEIRNFFGYATALEEFSGGSYNYQLDHNVIRLPDKLCRLGLTFFSEDKMDMVAPNAALLKKLDLFYSTLDTEYHCTLIQMCPNLEVLEESSLVDNDDDWLHELALKYTVLETLNFYRIPMFNINIQDLELIARNCPNLVSLKIDNHHEVLEIQNFFGYATALEEFSGEDKMGMVAPNAALLKKLDHFYSTLDTESLKILFLEESSLVDNDDDWLHELALNNTVLETLNFYRIPMFNINIRDLELIPRNCPNLVSLKIGNHDDVLDIRNFFGYATTLEEFSGGSYNYQLDHNVIRLPDKLCRLGLTFFSEDKMDMVAPNAALSLRIIFLEESSLVDNDDDWLRELALNNTVLETLNFFRIPMFNINIRDLELIARNCPNLVSLKIGNHHDVLEIRNFFGYATTLEEFSGGSYNYQLDHNVIRLSDKLCRLGLTFFSEDKMGMVAPNAALLKKLDIFYSTLDTEYHCTLIQMCPNLEVLELTDVIGDEGLEVLALCCRRLKKLRIEREVMAFEEPFVSQRGLIALSHGYPELEYLTVHVFDITNASLEHIGTHLKNLCDFCLVLLNDKETITDLPLDNGVRALLRGCDKLRRFALHLRPGGLTDVGFGYIGQYSPNDFHPKIFHMATLEFLAIVTLIDVPLPMPGVPISRVVSYWMNGAYRINTLDEFNIRCGFIQQEDIRTIAYQTTLWIIHARRESPGNVTHADLFALYCMHMGWKCNPGFFFLSALKHFRSREGTARKAGNIMVASLISPLAEYWDCPDEETPPRHLKPDPINGSALVNMQMLIKNGDSYALSPLFSMGVSMAELDSSQEIPPPPEFQQQQVPGLDAAPFPFPARVFGVRTRDVSSPIRRSSSSSLGLYFLCLEVESLTRKHVTIALCYATTPDRLQRRFVHLESLKLKGKPWAAFFHPLRRDWGGFATPWVREISFFHSLKSLHFRRMTVTDSDLQQLALSRGSVLQVLKLDKCSGFSTDGLYYIGRFCRSLRILFLEESSLVDNDGDWLHELALNNTVLETLNFYRIPMFNINIRDLELIARNCPNLVSLKIGKHHDVVEIRNFFGYATALEEFSGEDKMGMVAPNAALLKKLDLFYSTLDTEYHCTLIQMCPNLEVLELSLFKLEYLTVHVSDITYASLEHIGTHLKNLCDFRLVLLDDKETITNLPLDNGVRALLRGCDKLRRFALHLRPEGLTDVGFSYIGQYSPNVRSMLLGYVGETDAGLLEFSNGYPSLQKLEMRGWRDLLAMVRPYWNIELIPSRRVNELVEHPAQILAYYSLAGSRTDFSDTVIPFDPANVDT